MASISRDPAYLTQRQDMVENQLRRRGISDEKVLRSMLEVPRERFVPQQNRDDAYKDGPLTIGQGQTISQPYMVAVMTEALDLRPDEKVLEIGTGSGYQTAVLMNITRYVFSIERIAVLADTARATLESLGYEKTHIRTGDGTLGWPEESPFDGIIVTSGAPGIPRMLKDQLSDGGRLVIPAGSRHMQTLYKVLKTGTTFETEEITQCVFVPLIGAFGWNSDI